uniref:Uncharacterized protein n=1 Tax=Anopheles atroparvus TaxID=41427 RepID=A0A182IY71_ANOAO
SHGTAHRKSRLAPVGALGLTSSPWRRRLRQRLVDATAPYALVLHGSVPIASLCNVNPCANGGTCWTTEESFYCACRPGFTGKMCEGKTTPEWEGWGYWNYYLNGILIDREQTKNNIRP